MSGLRVLVCGGRRYDDAFTVGAWLGGFLRGDGLACIIQGGATGADLLARKFAEFKNIPVETYTADWSLGRKAGPLRNAEMLSKSRPDVVLAFPGGRGTADMVRRAKAAGVQVIYAGPIRDDGPALH